MKNHIDTYELYRAGRRIKYTIRSKITMTDNVDISILRESVNKAIKRYPYFRVEIVIEKDGGYNLIPNSRDIVVIETNDHLPDLGSKEVNKHLLYVDAKDKDININICHSIAGGKGFAPLIQTIIYQYVIDKYKVDLHVPNNRKPDDKMFEGENAQINIEDFKRDNTFNLTIKKGYKFINDYLKYFLNPAKSKPQYHVFTFNQKDIIKYTKENDSSVASAFIIFIFKSLCKILPKDVNSITAGISHNPTNDYGYPFCHSDILSHISISFDRSMENMDNELLGTITRGQIILQSDPNYSSKELVKRFSNYEKLDKKKTYLTKHLYAFRKCSYLSDGGGGTFVVNYTGRGEWGDLANYVESCATIVDGHLMSEITSMNDKLFLTFLQLNDNPIYIEAIKSTLNELNIPFSIKGPYRTNHVKVQKPKINRN